MRTLPISARDIAGLVAAVTGRGQSVRFQVTGSSMSPAVQQGDWVTIAPVGERGLVRNDIVLVNSRRPVLHRVVRIERDSGLVITRGDSHSREDSPVLSGQVIGRVVAVDRPVFSRARRLVSGILQKVKKLA